MSKEQLIQLIMWTMTHYGSDAGEEAEPGSKLRSQAEYIATVVEQFNAANGLLSVHGLDLIGATTLLDYSK